MKNNINKQIERDCVRQMLPCFALHFFRELLSLTLPVITSWMIGDMADALLSLDMSRIRGRLVIFSIAFLLDVLAQPAVQLWENLLMTRLGFGYGNQMFRRYLKLPMKDARKVDTATLVQRIDTDTTDYYFILMQKWTRPLTMTLYIVVLIVMFVTEKFSPIFIFTMSGLAAIPLLRAAINGKTKAKLKEAKLDYEESREGMEYAIFSARDFLKGFGIGERYIGRMHERYLSYSEKTGTKQDTLDAQDSMFAYLCAYGVPLGVIAVGALLIVSGNMGIGALLAGYLIMPTVTEFYQYFESLILNLHEEKVVRSRLEIFYSEQEDNGSQAFPKEVRFNNVSFAYSDGEATIFENRDLTLPLSGRVRIIGPNGVGKSTLLALLAGVYIPDGGEITDENGRILDGGSLRSTVSLQEQDGQIFSATVAENLFIPDDKLTEAETLLREMGFKKPLSSELSEGGANLSPGEKKKIMLVRSILKPAPVLALDEPLNHLDSKGEEVLIAKLTREKRPIIMVSHNEVNGLEFERLMI